MMFFVANIDSPPTITIIFSCAPAAAIEAATRPAITTVLIFMSPLLTVAAQNAESSSVYEPPPVVDFSCYTQQSRVPCLPVVMW